MFIIMFKIAFLVYLYEDTRSMLSLQSTPTARVQSSPIDNMANRKQRSNSSWSERSNPGMDMRRMQFPQAKEGDIADKDRAKGRNREREDRDDTEAEKSISVQTDLANHNTGNISDEDSPTKNSKKTKNSKQKITKKFSEKLPKPKSKKHSIDSAGSADKDKHKLSNSSDTEPTKVEVELVKYPGTQELFLV
ncbi:hypothetical protein RFI_09796, partial [Reticulomyxa filosa]